MRGSRDCSALDELPSFIGSLILWQRRHHPLSVIGIMIGFLAYYFLLLYHLKAMNL